MLQTVFAEHTSKPDIGPKPRAFAARAAATLPGVADTSAPTAYRCSLTRTLHGDAEGEMRLGLHGASPTGREIAGHRRDRACILSMKRAPRGARMRRLNSRDRSLLAPGLLCFLGLGKRFLKRAPDENNSRHIAARRIDLRQHLSGNRQV